jgi:hypothetical protein
MRVLYGKSQENLPNPPAFHLYGGGGVPDFPVSPSIGDAAGPALNQSKWKRPLTSLTLKPARYVIYGSYFLTFVYLFKVLL